MADVGGRSLEDGTQGSQKKKIIRRRKFAWACVFGFLGVNSLMALRYFFPRILFEPKTSFKIGYPSDFGFGVDTRFQQQHRIWVVRNAEGPAGLRHDLCVRQPACSTLPASRDRPARTKRLPAPAPPECEAEYGQRRLGQNQSVHPYALPSSRYGRGTNFPARREE